jgi:hypothetical protein
MRQRFRQAVLPIMALVMALTPVAAVQSAALQVDMAMISR